MFSTVKARTLLSVTLSDSEASYKELRGNRRLLSKPNLLAVRVSQEMSPEVITSCRRFPAQDSMASGEPMSCGFPEVRDSLCVPPTSPPVL